MTKSFRTTDTPANHCPSCGSLIEQATSAEGDIQPSEGSVAICFYCGELFLFDEDLTMRKPTVREMQELQTSNQWPQLERIVHLTKERIASEKRCSGV